jgi:hypothetical protein
MARLRAAELAAMLAAQMPRLAPELLPAGFRNGHHWRCGSLAGEAGQSLAINISGTKAGIWHDFATGEAGDALDLVAAVLFGGNLRAAMDWAASWLGVQDHSARNPATLIVRREAPPRQPDETETKRRRFAMALFIEAQRWLEETPVAAYLAARGIELDALRRKPSALRFHPACACTEAARPLPAMVAAIVSAEGVFLGCHRTWLEPDPDAPGAWRKATLRDPKRTLGRYVGGFIPLSRGASGQPFKRARKGETVAIAEGIETALSVAIARPDLRVIAAVALPNMLRLDLPRAFARVILCADNDSGNPRAADLLNNAAARFAADGREVLIARPPEDVKDFNDLLKPPAQKPNTTKAP